MTTSFQKYELGYESAVDSVLQKQIEEIDAGLRAKHGLGENQTSVGLFDLRTLRLATLRPDSEFYAASVAKIGILLAYFQLRRVEAANLDSITKHELGLMIKASSNELAAKFSRELGLKKIQEVIHSYHFYDEQRGGGLWVGKHYGENSERIGSPVSDNSHGASVRQLLRFYLLLQQGGLVSTEASQMMLDIFASPEIPHDDIKFVKGLSGRGLAILRKWGSWEDWLHDTAIIKGPNRHYILIALTRHARGDDYLVDISTAVDDLLLNS